MLRTTITIITAMKIRIHFPLLLITLTIVSEKRYKNHENKFHNFSALNSYRKKRKDNSFPNHSGLRNYPILTSFPNTA